MNDTVKPPERAPGIEAPLGKRVKYRLSKLGLQADVAAFLADHWEETGEAPTALVERLITSHARAKRTASKVVK
jgi:hypothetical protein